MERETKLVEKSLEFDRIKEQWEALTCMMVQCGLHVACGEADICMNSNFLCDIGDGQNLSENLSIFSAHIKNVLDILERVTPHYPEVKHYAEREEKMVNARMAFDKESLKPLYRLIIGEAAEKLYPEDYDFSIIFDSVENRKLRHKMGKHHVEGTEIGVE